MFRDVVAPIFNDGVILYKNEIAVLNVSFEYECWMLLNYQGSYECGFGYPFFEPYDNTKKFLYIISTFSNYCKIISNNENFLNELIKEYELKCGKVDYDRIKTSYIF